LPLQDWLPDLHGHPMNGVNVRMDFENNTFVASVFRDGAETKIGSFATYDEVLTPDPARRDTFELRISQTRLSFGMPAYGLTFVDESMPALGWSMGVVQFGHHSYTPTKANSPSDPRPNTWHWDNVEIAPAVPFTMVKATSRAVGGGAGVETVRFASAAPAGASLRFAGIGDRLEVSFDGGASWQAARVQPSSVPSTDDHFRSYWMPVPPGTKEVRFRADDWWGGPWRVRDLTIWSDNGRATPGPPASPPAPGGADGGPRLMDTRPGTSTSDGASVGEGMRPAGSVYELQVAGRAGVPGNATAVALNLTSAYSGSVGYVTAWPCGQSRPNASSLNYGPGTPVANSAIVQVGAGGKVCLLTAEADTHLIADVTGWFVGGTFVPA
jgi:hypothetical protein